MISFRVVFVSIFMLGGLLSSHNAFGVEWSCPNDEFARKAIISGEIETWPHFIAGPAMRVQKQHPNTAILAHAKYIEANNTTGAICQYYNHIGIVATFFALEATKAKTHDNAYWRWEYTASTPEEDDPEQQMMEVCMVDKNSLAHMSVGCSFNVAE